MVYKWYTSNWGIICHLPPFTGTRNNHWANGLLISEIELLKGTLTFQLYIKTCGGLVSLSFFLLRYVTFRVLNISYNMKCAILSTSSRFGMIRDVYEHHTHQTWTQLRNAKQESRKSKTKQRVVFGMVHVKDSLVPMGKVWFLDFQGVSLCIYIYIPGTQMTSVFEGQPPKTRPFPIKTRVIWVPGIYTITQIDVSLSVYPFATSPSYRAPEKKTWWCLRF